MFQIMSDQVLTVLNGSRPTAGGTVGVVFACPLFSLSLTFCSVLLREALAGRLESVVVSGTDTEVGAEAVPWAPDGPAGSTSRWGSRTKSPVPEAAGEDTWVDIFHGRVAADKYMSVESGRWPRGDLAGLMVSRDSESAYSYVSAWLRRAKCEKRGARV